MLRIRCLAFHKQAYVHNVDKTGELFSLMTVELKKKKKDKLI